jgi:hypothetical protein
MILIPCLLLACFTPGYLFPQMAARISAKRRKGDKSDTEKQPEQSNSQQPVTSGDDSAKEKPASTGGVLEPATKTET